MPKRPATPCRECGKPTSPPGYCVAHKGKSWGPKRQTVPTGTYGSDWRRTREAYVKVHPTCEQPGCHQPVAEVHHIIAVRDGGPRLDWSNLMSLCHHHHKSATRREIKARRARVNV